MDLNKITIKAVKPIVGQQMQDKLDRLAKPQRGLGNLERMVTKIASIQETLDIQVDRRTCLVFAADHGIEREQVSATPREVTSKQAINTINGHTTVAVLAHQNRCKVTVIDVGVDGLPASKKIINHKISDGTKDFLQENAMSRQEAVKAIKVGYEVAEKELREGAQLLLIGELGIGNTTTASTLMAAITGLPTELIVGAGSNISSKRFKHKIQVINEALRKRSFNQDDPVDLLAKVGGFEIGAMCGAILKAAEQGVPLIMDGFIANVAALLAQKINPNSVGYLIASHLSREPGAKQALNLLDCEPVLNLDLAVGEGSGAVLLLSMIDAMQAILQGMNTTDDLNFEFTK
ncbi:nicotinate-nucleotide--dimethylbenzimidazole phosphoribosyltransferase [Pediococcus claussenii]|uniref:Nicotinate-nucleotide--dimethylbenzimidazole phosphoribosyltransferase n=1 Tax=Pediococcus claussenii (strain ATCC BAA-344 / DSM 14800 / JCM 18046 / KCTC 3811 / LMG 21948 / P06) TaxID=701521 RepID=G8PEK3_PEDCP|nr:nicotinate-nucleotide--dimethylbenzimidazole phosphoribosyltransferase [Pediococcus claussenii]AEV95612.1 nicotinate-nucleotide-dimethylbenzimidazole phosphoribosyltransferase [Pediococcus claussenii ATCC BAA-344]ANZ69132.1 nicotinate-nucleotide--dimethylbenzimidazole phosphoribosyltransferase [Pediococcus claussenii]ANZ70949.1 nicotinate-nucleotide--dimethylbenzimidazole phosphoribosyltransferase [Pediococcus claussenii]KRN20155.1 cobT protein [Pediococcus claussenii]